jgi:hypothetical protein
MRCRREVEVERHRLPTAEEVLLAVLEENGVTERPDEKRAAYLPVIALFGGLQEAGEAFTASHWQVLQALRDGPRPLAQVMNVTRLGSRELPELARPDGLDDFLRHLSPTQQRIARQRFDAYWDRRFPTEATLPHLLELWADRGILTRCWQLPDCPSCGLGGWVEQLDIRQPIVCRGCGMRLRLPGQVSLAFQLNPLVRRAIQEGLGPVALTGRFLYELSGDGILWLPGMKYSWNGREGDIDFLACIDRHMVLAECKDLMETGPTALTWDKVFDQFRGLVDVAEACRADLVVLGVRAQTFPPDWESRVSQLVAGRVRVLMLAAPELERGNQYDQTDEMRGARLLLSEVMAQPAGVVRVGG